MDEEKVLDLPLDKFFLYVEAEERRRNGDRKVMISDTAGAVAGIFAKKGVSKYLKLLEEDRSA